MSTYLYHLVQTPATVAKLIAAPEDRFAAIASTGLLTTAVSSGALSSATHTRLLTVEEMLTALGATATTAYHAPGEPA